MTLLPTPGYFVGVPTYLYGPVPSPGVPSTLYVDLLNTQTAGGDKTWTGLQTVRRPAQVGVAEECQRWTANDNTGSFARIINGVASDNLFFPEIGGYVTSTSISALTRFSCELAVDAASSSAAMIFQTRVGPIASPVAVVNRTPFSWFNGPNAQMALTPTNDLALQVAGGGFRVKEGSNAKQGVATLVAGTVTVANTSITTTSRIQLTGQDNNATGALRVSARVVGTSFTITSSDVGATGVVAYFITEPS